MSNQGLERMDTGPKTNPSPEIDFARVYPEYVAAVSKLLIHLRQEVGGDLDLILILCVIGERHFANRADANTPTYETLGKTELKTTQSINTYSVSQYAKIPSETTRRKVAKLVQMGWVSSDEQGNLSATEKAATALAGGTDAALEFIQILASTVRK